MKRNRIWIAILALVLIFSLLTGCGSSNKMAATESAPAADSPAESYDDLQYIDEEFGYTAGMTTDGKGEPEEPQVDSVEGSAKPANAAKVNRKIIWTVDLNVETLEFDAFLTQLDQAVSDFGGYYEASNVSGSSINYQRNRDGYLTVRVPSAKLDDFITQVGTLGTVTYTSKSSEDITLNYLDVENRIATLQLEMEKLTQLMEEADSLDAIIQLEARLSEVRYSLENYTSTRNRYDSLVDYSTVNISLQEVKRVTKVPDQTVGQRIAAGWADTMYDLKTGAVDFFIWFVVNLPYILIWAVIIVAAAVVLIKAKRRKIAKNAALSAGKSTRAKAVEEEKSQE